MLICVIWALILIGDIMKILELTEENNREVFINFDNVVCFRKANNSDFTHIECVDGSNMFVKDSLLSIAKRLDLTGD